MMLYLYLFLNNHYYCQELFISENATEGRTPIS